ncbi:hypothetical protein [uncultured Aquimarina sp.]|uniref:hypothetical protein n=1 Tax=uncultured Aquimarina sp. TaxID=575652 RepID=UPI0026243CBF|nr:hypothetical protein [uncultured Aquimarina sp.]
MELIIISPKEENKYVKKLLEKIDSEFLPEQVPVKIEEYSEKLNCFKNVDRKVELDGGKPHYGWVIYQTSILCEAERHAVWENDEEELIDITPRDIDFEQVMFVSDNNFEYHGQIIDNYRVNITNNKIVDHFIKVCETLSDFYSLGKRKNDSELEIDPQIANTIYQYEDLKVQLELYIAKGSTFRSKCICGGRKNYKNCCGGTLLERINNDAKRIMKK